MGNGRAVMGLSIVGLTLLSVSCSQERQGDQQVSDLPDSSQVPSIAHPVAVVGDSSVGCLTLRAPIEAVRRACGEVRDTVVPVEGQLQPAIQVGVEGGSATAEIVSGRVWRIRVSDPALRTADSIRVGTPVSSLASRPGFRIVHGEGVFARLDSHCGKTFEIRGLPHEVSDWTVEQALALPDTARVAQILVVGHCDHG